MKVLLIGRGQNNDIVVTDPYVSRQHAQLVIHDDGRVSIVDLNSKTGTFVNGAPIQGEYFLAENDTIKIGNTVLPWKEYLNQFGQEWAADWEATSNGGRKKPKKILLALLSLLILAGAGAGGYYYYKHYYKKGSAATEEAHAETDAEDEEETEAGQSQVILDETYRLTLPEAFAPVESPEDTTALYAFEMDSPAIVLYIYHDSTARVKKNQKDTNPLTAYYQQLKEENFPEKIPPVLEKNHIRYMSFQTKSTDGILGHEALYHPGGAYLYRLSFKAHYEEAEQKDKARRIIRDIINSFEKNNPQEAETDTQKD